MTPPLRDAAAPVGGGRGEGVAGHAGLFRPHDTLTCTSTSTTTGAAAVPPEPPAPLAAVLARLPGVKPHPVNPGWLAGCPLCHIDGVVSATWRGATWTFEAVCGHRLHELASTVADRPAAPLPPPSAPQPARRPMRDAVSRRDGHRPRPAPRLDRPATPRQAPAGAGRVAELEARIARLEAENARLRERARRCTLRAWRERMKAREVERRLEYLEALHGRAMATLRNPALNPSQRLVAVAAALEVAHQAARDGRPDDAPVRVSVSLLAEQAGVSRDTAGAALKRLAAVGLLERTEERGRTPAGEARTEVHVRLPGGPLATLWRAACFRPRNAAEARRHGGRRERVVRVEPCPEHPEAPITTTCAVCGRALQATEAPRPPEPPGPGSGGGGTVRQNAAHNTETPCAEVFASEAAGRCGRCGRGATLLFLGADGAQCIDCRQQTADAGVSPCGMMPHRDGPRQLPFDDLPFEPPGAGDDAADGDVASDDGPPLIGICPRCGGALARAPGFLNWARCVRCQHAAWIGPAS
jgi:DNA-binding transcriptional ArsR family regulator